MTRAGDELLALPLGDLLEQLASEAPTPGGGAVAALTAAMGAGLVVMVARASPAWEGAGGAAAQGQALRRRLAPLAAENAEMYEVALVSLALPVDLAPDVRSLAIGNALARAADAPLRIAGAAADVALLAADAAERGEPALRPDAAAAAVLAEGATRAAAHLVEINLTMTEEDERVRVARALAQIASEGAARALASAREAP